MRTALWAFHSFLFYTIAPRSMTPKCPNLPAIITPAVLNVLVEKFNIQPIGEAAEDLNACLS
jgi:hypothetical protein